MAERVAAGGRSRVPGLDERTHVPAGAVGHPDGFSAGEARRGVRDLRATIGLATIMGPVLGGALISLDLFGLDWRLVFYVNVPIGIGALIAAALLLEETRAPDAPRLDLAGAAMVTLGLFLLVFPLTEGRAQGWPSWIFLMLGGAVAAAG